MGTGDLFGDFRERRIRRTGILESIFRYRDSVGAPVPFAHQPGARLQAETWIRSNSAFGPKHFRESVQLAPRRFAEPAMLDFLEPVADSSDQQVTTDPWRLAPIEPSPFMAKLVKAGLARRIGQVEDTFGKMGCLALPW
jgi:hypothetical protein